MFRPTPIVLLLFHILLFNSQCRGQLFASPDYQIIPASNIFVNDSLSFRVQTKYLSSSKTQPPANYSEWIGVTNSSSPTSCPFSWSLTNIATSYSSGKFKTTLEGYYRILIDNPLSPGYYSALIYKTGTGSRELLLPNYGNVLTCSQNLTIVGIINFTVYDQQAPVGGGGGYSLLYNSFPYNNMEISDKAIYESQNPTVTPAFSGFDRKCQGSLSSCIISPLYPSIVQNGLTIEAWIKMTPYPDQVQSTQKGCCWRALDVLSSGSSSLYLGVADHGSLSFGTFFHSGDCLDDASNRASLNFSQYNLLDGNSHHIAGVWDPSSNSKYFYVNGSLVFSKSFCTLASNWDSLVKKYLQVRVGDQLEGEIDEVRLWGVARSASEINSYMFRSLRDGQITEKLLIYYNFDRPWELKSSGAYVPLTLPPFESSLIQNAAIQIVIEDLSGNGFHLSLGLLDDFSSIISRKAPTFHSSSFPIYGAELVVKPIYTVALPGPNTQYINNVGASGANKTTGVTFISSETPLSSLKLISASTTQGLLFYINYSPVAVNALPRTISATSFVLKVVNTGISKPATITLSYILIGNTGLSGREESIRILVIENRTPRSGTAGKMLFCDGYKMFAVAPKFKMPVQNNNPAPSQGPMTIEFWCKFANQIKWGMPFDLGNGEVLGQWCGNDWYCYGRVLLVIQSDSSVIGELLSGSLTTDRLRIDNSGNAQGLWMHLAVTHDGISGNSSIYMNGDLITSNFNRSLIYADLNGLFLCHWPFWGPIENSFRGFIDEFRVWNVSRSAQQIKDNYLGKVSRNEPGLVVYYDFDYLTVGEPIESSNSYVNNIINDTFDDSNAFRSDTDNDYYVPDRSGNNFHLALAGCVPNAKPFCNSTSGPCSPDDKPSVQCYYNPSDLAEPLKIAYYQGMSTVRANISLPDRRPIIRTSSAPIGGFHPEVISIAKMPFNITLFEDDPDTEDLVLLNFFLVKGPSFGVLTTEDGTRISEMILFSSRLITFRPNADLGGLRCDSFSYMVTDSLFHPSSPTTVYISLMCPAGSFLNGGCQPCPPGTFQKLQSYSPSCSPCPLNSYQPKAGQLECLSVPKGYFQDSIGSSDYKSCVAMNFPVSFCDQPQTLTPLHRSISYIVVGTFSSFALLCLLGTLYYRGKTIFLAASLSQLLIILTGILMELLGLLLLSMPKISSHTCPSLIWLMTFGISLILSPIIAKLYRLFLIFNSTGLKSISLSINRMLALEFSTIAVDAVMLIWLTVKNPQLLSKISDPNVLDCNIQLNDSAITAIIVWKLLMLLCGLYLLYATRNVPSLFQETKYLGQIFSNTIITGVLLLVLNFSLTGYISFSSQLLMTIIMSAFSLFLTTGLLFVPKFIYCHEGLTAFFGVGSVDSNRNRGNHTSGIPKNLDPSISLAPRSRIDGQSVMSYGVSPKIGMDVKGDLSVERIHELINTAKEMLKETEMQLERQKEILRHYEISLQKAYLEKELLKE